MGGKAVVAKYIAAHIRDAPGDIYLEPMVGAASVLFHVLAPGRAWQRVIASDLHQDLIRMWRAASTGWTPPIDITREDYESLRVAEPSALRGFVGFACSYGGGWFNGWAPEGAPRPKVPYGNVPVISGSRQVAKKAARFASVTWQRHSYEHFQPVDGWVVYLDPPYRDVRQHNPFDHDHFWTVARRWSQAGASVFVSEYVAPTGWQCVLERQTPRKMEGNHGRYQTERLWIYG